MQCAAPVRRMIRAGRIRGSRPRRGCNAEGIVGVVWAFCLGLAAASGALVGQFWG